LTRISNDILFQDEGNPTNKLVALDDVQQELKSMLKHKRISTYKMTVCDKKYAFSANSVPKEATYIKLNYSYKGINSNQTCCLYSLTL
jgi:uncharacterized protein YxeA